MQDGIGVAGVAHTVAVPVALGGVGRIAAVVLRAADAVSVRVVERIGRAGVAGVAEGVAILVGLGGVADGGAVVTGAVDAVVVRVDSVRIADIARAVAVAVEL